MRSTRFYRFMRFFVVGYVRVVYRVRVVGREHVPRAGRTSSLRPTVRCSTSRWPARSRPGASGSWARPRCSGCRCSARSSRARRVPGRARRFRLRPPPGLAAHPRHRRTARRVSGGHPPAGRVIAPLQAGAAYLAAKANVPIVPIGIAGAEETFRTRRGLLPGFGRIIVVVGEPIPAPVREGSVVKRSAVDELSDTLRERLQKLIDEAYSLRQAAAQPQCRTAPRGLRSPFRIRRKATRDMPSQPSCVSTSEASMVRSEPNGPPAA